MKIAILSRYQNQNQRGVETFVKELTSRLKTEFEIDILTDKEADSISKITQGNYDIVMPLNGRSQALKVFLGKFFSGYKVVIGGHSGPGRDDIWNLLVGRPDVFVALTERQLNWAKRYSLGVKLIKIPNGIDLNIFNPTGQKYSHGLKSPVILSVGALVWYKHHDLVIKAVSNLKDVSLLIVGQGPLKENLEKLAEKKVPGRYKILSLSYSHIPDLYRSADVFTLPSWDREAFGIVYLEAMASGLPVVAPNDLSRREIIGEGGLLVDVENIDLYSQAIQSALEKNWGQKPRQQASKFSWDLVAQKYTELFRSLQND